MPNRAIFEAAAVNVFNAFGDIIEDVTYTSAGAFNPVTETTTGDATEAIRVSFKPLDKDEADGDIMVGDTMATIIQSEMTLTPKIDDTLVLDGVNYIARSVVDKYKVLWELHLRRV